MNVESLVKKHEGLIHRPNGTQCGAGASKHRALIEALCERGLPVSAVHRILKAEGIDVSYNTIQRHHRKACLCR